MDIDRQSADPLRRGLLDLKERGCNLLVINDAPGVEVVCDRLGGHANHGRRRCYVPITTTVTSILDRHAPAPMRSEYLGVVDATTAATRATASPIQPGRLDVNAEWYTPLENLADLPELARLIETHLDRFADRAGRLDPGEVRLCVESLDPFLDEPETDGSADVGAFLDSVTDLVRERRAIGHFHVSSGMAGIARAPFESFFEATVRIRTDDGTVHQRWMLHDAGVETDWLPLERR